MKKSILNLIISILSVVFLTLFVISYVEKTRITDITENSLKGEGTFDKPYLIENADDLRWLRDSVNSGKQFEDIYFLQTKDIDLENEKWIPIGKYSSGKYFYGIYDGGSYTIENLLIDGR